MAKRHRRNLVTASFHYLIKTRRNEQDPLNPIEIPFSNNEFDRILDRLRNIAPINVAAQEVALMIKMGEELPFSLYQDIGLGLHFGSFEGAYYGQRYRNNLHGEISADSLNLRKFHYIITKDRTGRIIVGVTYNGQFGDYDGMKSCLIHLARCNDRIASRSIVSLTTELGAGVATEIRLSYRKGRDRDENDNIFSRNGALAIKRGEFGDGFDDAVRELSDAVRGEPEERKKIIADLLKDGHLIELDDDDIVDCTAIVKHGKQQKTVYFLGQSDRATKFYLGVEVDRDGAVNDDEVREALRGVYLNEIVGLMRLD